MRGSIDSALRANPELRVAVRRLPLHVVAAAMKDFVSTEEFVQFFGIGTRSVAQCRSRLSHRICHQRLVSFAFARWRHACALDVAAILKLDGSASTMRAGSRSGCLIGSIRRIDTRSSRLPANEVDARKCVCPQPRAVK